MAPASIAPSQAVSQRTTLTTVTNDTKTSTNTDELDEETLEYNNRKLQLRGFFVSLGGLLGWALVAIMGCVLLKSNPVALSLPETARIERLHAHCGVAWAMFTGLAGTFRLCLGIFC